MGNMTQSRILAQVAVLVGLLATLLFASAGQFGIWSFWVYLAVWAIYVRESLSFLYRDEVQASLGIQKPRSQYSDNAEVMSGEDVALPMKWWWSEPPRDLLHAPGSYHSINEAAMKSFQPRDWLTRMLFGPLLVLHYLTAGIDLGRLQLTLVPIPLRILGVLWLGLGLSVVHWTMRTRRPIFRGMSAGPYIIVRHPIYLGVLLCSLASGMALGSWISMIPTMLCIPLIVRRTNLEDRLLEDELPSYERYVAKVRFRLIPGLF